MVLGQLGNALSQLGAPPVGEPAASAAAYNVWGAFSLAPKLWRCGMTPPLGAVPLELIILAG